MLIPTDLGNIDFLYDSDNDLGIPSLLLDSQARGVALPVEAWGTVPRSRTMAGTYVLFVYDDFLNPLWKQPEKMLNSGCDAVCEPNFTITKDMPVAIGLYQIYRKRWLSRFWSEHGINIFVDLNVPEKFAELNMLGVPEGWSSFSTRGYADFMADLDRQTRIAKDFTNSGKLLMLVYGGGKLVQEYCRDNSLVYVETWPNRKQSDGTRLEGEDAIISPKGLLERVDGKLTFTQLRRRQ